MFVRKNYKKLLALVLAMMIPVALCYNIVSADGTSNGEKAPKPTAVTSAEPLTYQEYIDQYRDYTIVTTESVVAGGDYQPAAASDLSAVDYNGKINALLWKSGRGNVSFQLDIPKTGFYNFAIEFLPLNNGEDFQVGFLLDGKVPFAQTETLSFSRDWVNATKEPRTDKEGNELSSEQVMSPAYVYRTATDDTGVVLEPFQFALTAGKHTVTLVGRGYPVALARVSFVAPEVALSYKEVSKNHKIKGDPAVKPIVIHAEDAAVKTNKILVAKSSNTDAGMTPSDPYCTKLNYIGGGSWNTPGQKLQWDFTVEKTGYYAFGARYKQNELIGGESWRWLKIDGKTPFREAKEMRFSYGTGWQHYRLGKKEPYYIYLEAGKHTLSLEVTLGELSEYYYRLNRVVTELGDLYLNIVMITGETPDVNRDYELFTQIPNFTEVLTNAKKELSGIVRDMNTLSGSNGSQYTAAINNLNRVIDKMIERKYASHLYVSDFYSSYTTVSSWLNEMKNMPLALDEIQLVYAQKDFDWHEPSFFEKIWFAILRFLKSFTADYTAQADSDKYLKIWVNWGRDQTLALDSLIKETFTEKTGIKVELQMVNNSLINGLLANNYPDLQINLTRTDPVNYGMRGALTDLTEFPDYKEVLKHFYSGADEPYWYDGALYALPDTQTFYTMFYRTDIFERLGLTVPKTWDDFLYCTTILQRYNMNVYVPYTQIVSTTTVNAGIGSLHLYPTLMLQGGLNLYNDARNATELTTPKGIEIFEEWTDMYTDYGYLKEADFYNRFRNGSMPLGVAPYTTYLTLYSAAPEIKGRWALATVPGLTAENNCVAGGGTGCAIVKRSKHQKEAWEFLKWWTSAETQARYSGNVESILGILGRIPTSNVEAFQNLSWNPNDLSILLEQFGKVKELPEVPGSYYLSRAVDQAFWAVINDSENPKDAIITWAKTADSEIERKIAEYQNRGDRS